MIPQRVLAFYGDDFTGSTDLMEVLTWAGLPTVLFVGPPDENKLARFPDARAIGIAGDSRSRSPEWMSEHLPGSFEILKRLGAPLNQYKVCSTFDSSPTTGSIGRALEIGQDVFETPWSAIVVGAPALSRYQAFGNLFARVGDETFRLDRHPTMSRHPVTPMAEGDLRGHLERQTDRKTGLVDLLALKNGGANRALDGQIEAGARAVFVDVIDEETLVEAGRLVWERRPGEQSFTVSSSGLQYALAAYWRAAGEIGEEPPRPTAREVDQVVVVSGSCSPETEASIRWATANGFHGVRLDAEETAAGRIEQPLREALEALASGRSVVLYSALGPEDPSLVAGDGDLPRKLGEQTGRVLDAILERSEVRRCLVCGGDTSSHAVQQLGFYALTAIAPAAPGSPICRAWADGPVDGLEIVLKGGQRGGSQFFEEVRRGRVTS